jgi:hypothetical protein
VKKIFFSTLLLIGLLSVWHFRYDASTIKPLSVDCNGFMCSKYVAQPNAVNIKYQPLHEAFSSSSISENTTQERLLDSLIDQNYSILFSYLSLSPQVKIQLRELLRQRERIAARAFYDASSNAAEVANNLRERDEAVGLVDKNIEEILSPDDAKNFNLLKDSNYEQAQLGSLYKLFGDINSIPPETKKSLLLDKLELKKSTAQLIQQSNTEIENASPTTKQFLITTLQKKLLEEQQNYFLTTQAKLDEVQFKLLYEDEQQQFTELWRVLSSNW